MVNKVILIGNVGQDPEIRSTQDGKEVATFSLATSERWRDKNSKEVKEKTEWHRVVVFAQGLVGVIKSYVKKGAKLYIEGQLQTRKWTDSNGADRYSTEIVLQNFNAIIEILDGKSEKTKEVSKHGKAKANGYQEQNEMPDDEIPF